MRSIPYLCNPDKRAYIEAISWVYEEVQEGKKYDDVER